MTTWILYTVTMKNSYRSKKVCERGVRPMIRVLMMLVMAMTAYLVATMDEGVQIEID